MTVLDNKTCIYTYCYALDVVLRYFAHSDSLLYATAFVSMLDRTLNSF